MMQVTILGRRDHLPRLVFVVPPVSSGPALALAPLFWGS
jgi:hypothetical protein